MAKNNNDFFVKKKDWSTVKDELLGCYFKPYVSKILHTYRPLVYVDCFAGKGKFEDGNDGSPLIALKIISECLESTTVQNPEIETSFVDLNYADDLRKNLSAYPEANIVSGKYEDNIKSILRNKNNCNVFLYIDPYGIKALQCSFFDDFAKETFNSIELLINMNSFGFIREACHALGTTFDDKSLFADLVEYEPTKLDESDKSINELNEIAGGDYWREIIEAYKNGEIDGYEAEDRFAEKYCERLRQSYSYVLNMPLRIKRGQRPKYRLIHATNHRDGCLLMVDNICNRWEALQDIQTGGQMSMFEEDCNNQVVDEEDIKCKTKEFFSQCTEL
ncbi:MAG: three-Cys-motif partner protein TcmP, partial [Clostridia bacterium]|nr:three-Cys-motif partner protein TcmP [Clostridia bacterium]